VPRTNVMGAHLSQQTVTERVAASILARDGIAAIRKLREAATDANRAGYPSAAAAFLELADAMQSKRTARRRLRDRFIKAGGEVAVAGYPLA
jgi:hypothetical protein